MTLKHPEISLNGEKGSTDKKSSQLTNSKLSHALGKITWFQANTQHWNWTLSMGNKSWLWMWTWVRLLINLTRVKLRVKNLTVSEVLIPDLFLLCWGSLSGFHQNKSTKKNALRRSRPATRKLFWLCPETFAANWQRLIPDETTPRKVLGHWEQNHRICFFFQCLISDATNTRVPNSPVSSK